MDIEQQKEILALMERYYNTPKEVIQGNINKAIEQSGYKKNHIAEKLSITPLTVYAWGNMNRIVQISFETALKLSVLLNISITELM